MTSMLFTTTCFMLHSSTYPFRSPSLYHSPFPYIKILVCIMVFCTSVCVAGWCILIEHLIQHCKLSHLQHQVTSWMTTSQWAISMHEHNSRQLTYIRYNATHRLHKFMIYKILVLGYIVFIEIVALNDTLNARTDRFGGLICGVSI